MVDYDAELRLYAEVFPTAWEVGPREDVVDIGCGTGGTTRQAGRLAVDGSALGIDVSAAAVAEARRVTREDGLRNVAFECGDAQIHGFADRGFDLAISRFGTMFFSEPVAAFSNIGRGLRHGGRLVMMVWQAWEQNEWAVAIDRALGGRTDSAGLDPFSLGDPAAVRAILHAAGFADVTFADIRRPVYYGPDVDAALGWVGGFTSTREALERLDPSAAEEALSRLRALVAEHLGGDGVWFDSSAWVVTARR